MASTRPRILVRVSVVRGISASFRPRRARWAIFSTSERSSAIGILQGNAGDRTEYRQGTDTAYGGQRPRIVGVKPGKAGNLAHAPPCPKGCSLIEFAALFYPAFSSRSVLGFFPHVQETAWHVFQRSVDRPGHRQYPDLCTRARHRPE